MNLISTFPAAAGRWELVATMARKEGVLIEVLVARLQHLGCHPQRICGAWMVRVDELEETYSGPVARPVNPIADDKKGSAFLDESAVQKLLKASERQADQIQALQRQLAELMEERGQA